MERACARDRVHLRALGVVMVRGLGVLVWLRFREAAARKRYVIRKRTRYARNVLRGIRRIRRGNVRFSDLVAALERSPYWRGRR